MFHHHQSCSGVNLFQYCPVDVWGTPVIHSWIFPVFNVCVDLCKFIPLFVFSMLFQWAARSYHSKKLPFDHIKSQQITASRGVFEFLLFCGFSPAGNSWRIHPSLSEWNIHCLLHLFIYIIYLQYNYLSFNGSDAVQGDAWREGGFRFQLQLTVCECLA